MKDKIQRLHGGKKNEFDSCYDLRTKESGQIQQELKEKFVKPTGENKKIILIKKV
jgi:phosphoglycerate-specific signal transduction histidine kinase